MQFLKTSIKNAKTDDQLVADFRQSGDEACIEILFNRYCHLVFAVSMNHLHNEEESKDAVIEIFAKMPHDLAKYEIRNFGSWIYRVTKNYCYHQLTKKKKNLMESLDSVNGQNHQVQVAMHEMVSEDEFPPFFFDHLEEALKSLNEEQRKCVELFYLRQKSYEEIEKATGYDYNQVKSYIQNGKRNLKMYLEKIKDEQR